MRFFPVESVVALVLSAFICASVRGADPVQPVDKVPDRTDDNLIVAAYNIQFFGKNAHDLRGLAKIIQSFDVCGIIEVQGEAEIPKLVKELKDLTGKEWGHAFGVRTNRPGGSYHEAFAAVWRRDRVEVGEGVIGGIFDLEEKYRNDPYLISFKRKNFDFILALLHTRWTNDDEGTREDEVLMIADQIHWMKNFITERDVIIAGDFNYPGTDTVMQTLIADAELMQLNDDPLSTFKANGQGFASSYDHMFTIKAHSKPEFVADSCATLNTAKIVYGDNSVINMRKARRDLSDHLPVFAEFKVNAADDD